jgi:hypothetical protein
MFTFSKHLPFLAVYLLGISGLTAQRNSFSAWYGPVLGKTSLEDIDQHFFNGHFSVGAVKALPGYAWGLAYERQVSERWQIGIGGRYALRGQRSPHYFHAGIGRPAAYPDGYGGGAYDLKYFSSELSLWSAWQAWRRGPWVLSLRAGLTGSLLDNAFVQNYVVEKHTGIKRAGCCTNFYSYHQHPYFERTSRHFQHGYYRFGGLIASRLQYSISDWLSFSIMPEAVYLGRHQKASANYLGEATIAALGCMFMLGFHF